MTGPYPPSGAPGPDPTSNPAPDEGASPYGSVPSQPANPPYGQPAYGQPAYGQQPQYGQPSAEPPTYVPQPQYGQPATPPPAEPQYGQPQYGQPQYGQPQRPAPAPAPDPAFGQPQQGQFPPPDYAPPAAPAPFQGVPTQAAPGYPGYPPPGQATTEVMTPFPPAYQAPATPPKSGSTLLKTVGRIGGVILIGLIILVVRNGLPDFFNEGTPRPTQAVPSGISATSDGKAAPTAPFEDTPAAEYPEGEAGINLPAATAVSGFSKAQVEAALKKVKQGLIAGRLDPKMLTSHDNSALLKLLAPDAAEGIKEDFAKKNFFVYATQIATGHTLTSDPVRVSGRVTFRAATNDDIRMLEVITNFVWVYPFAGELEEPGDHLVVVHDEITWAFPVDADVEKGSRGMWIYEAQGFASNMDCDLLDQSLVGLGEPMVAGPGAPQDEDAPFDPNGTLDITDTC